MPLPAPASPDHRRRPTPGAGRLPVACATDAAPAASLGPRRRPLSLLPPLPAFSPRALPPASGGPCSASSSAATSASTATRSARYSAAGTRSARSRGGGPRPRAAAPAHGTSKARAAFSRRHSSSTRTAARAPPAAGSGAASTRATKCPTRKAARSAAGSALATAHSRSSAREPCRGPMSSVGTLMSRSFTRSAQGSSAAESAAARRPRCAAGQCFSRAAFSLRMQGSSPWWARLRAERKPRAASSLPPLLSTVPARGRTTRRDAEL
mmetsp:Transcript_18406/g.61616  ORF Transcript_18406/g.61616 Transcript_18406/m.61616 type:complete len:267 (-) Transcript_18406:456-1256(-)